MFRYYNANPNKSNIDDCTIRALAVAEDISWQEAYDILSQSARDLGLMMSSVEAIELFLDSRYDRVPVYEETVGEFIDNHPKGTYLITMPGHITVLKGSKYNTNIQNFNYDTFNSSKRNIWNAWEV